MRLIGVTYIACLLMATTNPFEFDSHVAVQMFDLFAKREFYKLKRMKRHVPAIWILCVSAVAHADIHNCDGVWSNRACSGKPSESMPEKASEPLSEQARLAAKKRFIFTDLDLRRLRYMREGKETINIDSAKEACFSSTSSLVDCQQAVDAANAQIDTRIEVTAKATPVVAPADKPSTTVIVQQNEPSVWDRRHRRHENERHNDGDNPRGLPRERQDSPLGSIWRGPGNSIPLTVPQRDEHHH